MVWDAHPIIYIDYLARINSQDRLHFSFCKNLSFEAYWKKQIASSAYFSIEKVFWLRKETISVKNKVFQDVRVLYSKVCVGVYHSLISNWYTIIYCIELVDTTKYLN